MAPVGIENHAIDGVRGTPCPGAGHLESPLHRANAFEDLGPYQNRKYLCAIGSTSAGAQVNSSPSAVTS